MSSKYKFYDPDGCYFVTFAVVGWVDLFTRNIYKDILIDSWKHCQQHKGLLVHAYVVMTNHVHMIISRNSDELLENIMRDMKKFTSSKLLEAIKKEPESRREWMLSYFRYQGEKNANNKIYQVWQQDNHPVECGSASVLRQKMDYLHENPVRAGFVRKGEDWIYSSAGHYYCGKESLIELSYV